MDGVLFAAWMATEDNLPSLIEPGAAHNKKELKALNVTHVLVVALGLQPNFPGEFIYKRINVLDIPETRLDDYFEECFNFIDQAKSTGGNVLVHCVAGRSRRYFGGVWFK